MATYYVKTTGDDTTGDGSEGSPWASPGYGIQQCVDGDLLYVQSGTYTLSDETPGNSDSIVQFPNHITLRMEGYETTAGDMGTKPVIDFGALTSQNAVTLDGDYNDSVQAVRNIKVTNASAGAENTGFRSLSHYQADTAIDCEAVDCNIGFDTEKLTKIHCKANSCTTGFFMGDNTACVAHACGVGYNLDRTTALAVQCLAVDCTGNGFRINGYNCGGAYSCTAYNCGTSSGHGFVMKYDMCRAVNCVAYGCGGYGFDTQSTEQRLYHCASGDNTSGDYTHTLNSWQGNITITDSVGDVFEDAANDDFRPVSGSDLYAAGIGTLGQTDNQDIGSVQHTDPSGGGGTTIPQGLHNIEAGVTA